MKIQLKKKKFVPFEVMVFVFCSALCACGLLERHPESGYSNRLSPHQLKRSQTISSREDSRSIEKKTRLKQLENSISTKKELEQYSRVLPYLKDEDERIYFLSMPGYEARQKWLKDENINSRTLQAGETYKELIEAQDIGLGMTQNWVRKSWGEPDNIEVSGNPQFRNERWKYNKYVSTPDGYKLEKKIVYFEGGRVVGWDVE
ncbi:MAG: hypothetical protein ACK5P7_10855 [Bdellovibrio sp.]|jgi:hypothetical protein